MKYYVNLPLSWVNDDVSWLEKLFSYPLPPELGAKPNPELGAKLNPELGAKLNPELGLDERSMALPLAWHRQIAGRIRGEGLVASVHLPFYMTPPGLCAGEAAWRKSVDLLLRAVEIAEIYGAEHLVGHPGFAEGYGPAPALPRANAAALPDSHTKYAALAGRAEQAGLLLLPTLEWLERSARAWGLVMERAGRGAARLYLENTVEASPLPLLCLLEELPRAGMCFDLGHWFSFAQGAVRNNLEGWLGLIAPRLGHLHLHDNDGSGDQHIGLGRGLIPLDAFLERIRALGFAPGSRPAFTLEPHDLESLGHSLGWVQSRLATAGQRP